MSRPVFRGLLLVSGAVIAIAASQVMAQTGAPAGPGAPGAPAAAAGGRGGAAPGGAPAAGRAAAPAGPTASQRAAMQDNLPATPIVKPKKARKVLVYTKPAGFAHSVIPLAAETITALGDKTGAWTTTVSNDPAVFDAANLAQYDAIVLDNNTGFFLDDPTSETVTAARRAALMDFVRGGKGLVGLHSAADSYHIDADGVRRTITGNGPQTPGWPDFNTAIGGMFRWHWPFPQEVTVKLDDPRSPLTRMFPSGGFKIHDEIYVYDNSFSRSRVHVLMSIDYSKMSDADKAKETGVKRPDGDYPLSWIRREGQGRVFYQALGHDEHVLAIPAMLQNLMAGVQYATGDLAADDRPSQR